MDALMTPTLKEETIKNLRASVAAVGILNGAKCGLGKVDKDIPATITLAELEADEADFDGYAQNTVVWSVATIGSDGDYETIGTVPEFRPTGATTPNTVYYYWVTDSAGTKVLLVGKFDAPGVPMASALNAIELVIRHQPLAETPVANAV